MKKRTGHKANGLEKRKGLRSLLPPTPPARGIAAATAVLGGVAVAAVIRRRGQRSQQANRGRWLRAIAFNSLETLFALEPIAARMHAAGLPRQAVDVWFARTLRDSMALDSTGTYQSFRKVGGGNLELLLAQHGLEPDEAVIERVLAALSELPAHADVRPAFEMLKQAGILISVITNGTAQNASRLLQNAGLKNYVRKITSADEVRHSKPHREIYLHAAHSLGVAPHQLALIAAHGWDLHGAAHAGLLTGWVNRFEKVWHPQMAPPDVMGSSLPEVVEKLLALRSVEATSTPTMAAMEAIRTEARGAH